MSRLWGIPMAQWMETFYDAIKQIIGKLKQTVGSFSGTVNKKQTAPIIKAGQSIDTSQGVSKSPIDTTLFPKPDAAVLQIFQYDSGKAGGFVITQGKQLETLSEPGVHEPELTMSHA